MLVTNEDIIKEANTLINLVSSQFNSRTVMEGVNAKLSTHIRNRMIWFVFENDRGEEHNVTVPLPFIENGVQLIHFNNILRAVCDHYDVENDKRISFLSAIQTIFLGDFTKLIENARLKKSTFIQRVAFSMKSDQTLMTIHLLQKAIGELINKMPLHETNMNSFIMNNRLMFIDQEFDGLVNPEDKLIYHEEKNTKFFDRGWTSVGLSDGSIADKNYMLTHDLRRYCPFGNFYHNPQRNLYSTLGMKGDELPNVLSQSMKNLMDKGIKRTGWNLMTAFVDVPDTFEDQILLDKSLSGKLFTTKERRIQCFGKLMVNVGQKLSYDSAISVAPDGTEERFNVYADEAFVKSINKTATSIGGLIKESYEVIISIKRYVRDATKITNSHGNKGVIRFKDLGYAFNEKTGEKVKIEVIVSAKTIGKRKNYGQILELLFNNMRDFEEVEKSTLIPSAKSVFNREGAVVTPELSAKILPKKPTVLDDNYKITNEEFKAIEAKHIEAGFKEGCVLSCDTYAGKFDAMCGKVFWGVIKDPEDQIWPAGKTFVENGKGLRTAGLKFSMVEFRALETIFGEDNAVTREILTYAQGNDLLEGAIEVLKGKKGEFPKGKKIVHPNEIKVTNNLKGTLFSEMEIEGTMADEFFHKDGFLLQLPVRFQTAIPENPLNEIYEGMAAFNEPNENYKEIYTIDKLVIPKAVFRRKWKHGSGLFGMGEISSVLNSIVSFCQLHEKNPGNPYYISNIYRFISKYFACMSSTVSTKRGLISNQFLSVRYPYSAKAVMTLSNDLPENTVEIHRDAAKEIRVNDGDYVIFERFPCLGFMGIRPQRVVITDDPMCKFTMRASGRSLVSTNLDFDGDVGYIAAFNSKEAIAEIKEQWENPHESYWKHIEDLNSRKGKPEIYTMKLDDYKIEPFPELTSESQTEVVSKLAGVKANTGVVIATTYNIMRLVENSGKEIDRNLRAEIEMFSEKVGQSVFQQKHGVQSLHEIVLEALGRADKQALIDEEFNEDVSNFICDLIKEKAAEVGVHDLNWYYDKFSSLVSGKVVREQNRLYYLSRVYMEGCSILKALESKANDLPNKIFEETSVYNNNSMNMLKIVEERKLLSLVSDNFKEDCRKVLNFIDELFGNVAEQKELTWHLI